MWYLIHLVAAPLGFLFGMFCVLTAIVLYPGEEGKIQSKFEDFWIRVDDYKNLALSRHAAFVTGVAKLETKLLDRVFGHSLFSGRAMAVSVLLSLDSLGLTYTYAGLTHSFGLSASYFDLVCAGIYVVISIGLIIAFTSTSNDTPLRVVAA